MDLLFKYGIRFSFIKRLNDFIGGSGFITGMGMLRLGGIPIMIL